MPAFRWKRLPISTELSVKAKNLGQRLRCYEILPSFEELKADRLTYARSFYTQYL